jgi:hypothetical protein
MEIIITPKVEIEEELLHAIKVWTEVENQVVVHIHMKLTEYPMRIRIWPSTYLISREGNVRVKLLNTEGICKAPQWTNIYGNRYSFTLIFEGLPNGCNVFDLLEDVSSPERFEYNGVARNQSDVYHLTMLC